MPQTDFFLNEKERSDFIEFAFNKKCKLVPNLHFSSPVYPVITDAFEYSKYSRKAPLFFLLNDRYSVLPLKLDSFKDENGFEKYYIKQRHGGPSIDFFSPLIGEIKDNIVGPGFIGVYDFYYDMDDKKFSSSKDLKYMFKMFSDYIKKVSKKYVVSYRTYWIGNSTIDGVKKGKVQLEPISNINLQDLILKADLFLK